MKTVSEDSESVRAKPDLSLRNHLTTVQSRCNDIYPFPGTRCNTNDGVHVQE